MEPGGIHRTAQESEDLVQKSEAGEQCLKGLAKWKDISEELVGRGFQEKRRKVSARGGILFVKHTFRLKST